MVPIIVPIAAIVLLTVAVAIRFKIVLYRVAAKVPAPLGRTLSPNGEFVAVVTLFFSLALLRPELLFHSLWLVALPASAVFFGWFYKRPGGPPRPGERILQRHATGSRGQLGGSRLMDPSEVVRAGWCRSDLPAPHLGLIDGKPIVYPGDSHLLTVAAAGTGKSSGPVAANLIAYPGSIVATDPKGELTRLTAHWRASQGVAVHVVDPWGVVPEADIPGGVRATFNPLDMIPGEWDGDLPVEGPDSIDNAYLIADAILMQGSQTEPHWDRTAKALISGLLLLAALDPEWKAARTLTAVNDLLALPPDALRMFLEAAGKSPVAPAAAEINQFLAKGEREASGVLSTVNVNMRFLQGTAMRSAAPPSTGLRSNAGPPPSISVCRHPA